MNNPEIFVSYAWKGESEALVDKLCQVFAAKSYKIIRDKSTMTYKDSIKNFMDSIGRGKFIIAVVGDKYMKSEYCMYEAYRMFQSPAFRERVFPIVLPDADIFSVRGQVAYLKYWHTEFEALETEYKSIAASSPTMAAPLAERLRDIEVTTRFINDFMTQVADMNVLTSQTHIESDFSQLIFAIEERMKEIEIKEGEKLISQDGTGSSSSKETNSQKQEAIMSDDHKVDTGGGDHVGRDKHVHGNETNIRIGGSVSRSNIVVGNNNIVTNNTSTQNIFAPVYDAIKQSSRSTQDKEDLQAEVQEIEATVSQSESIDEPWLTRRLRALKKIAPDIAEVALSALAGPGAAIATVAKKIAEKVKAEQ